MLRTIHDIYVFIIRPWIVPLGSHLPSPSPAPKLRAHRSSSPQKAPPRCTSGQLWARYFHCLLPPQPAPAPSSRPGTLESWGRQLGLPAPDSERQRPEEQNRPMPHPAGRREPAPLPGLPSRPPAAHALCPNPGLSYCTAAMEPSQEGASLTSSQDGSLKGVQPRRTRREARVPSGPATSPQAPSAFP